MFVDLSAVTDPELLVPLVARAVGAGEETVQAVGSLLDEREVLLVLDNLEQILPAGSQLAEVLAAAPSLRVLVTSRAALRLSYEQEYCTPEGPAQPAHGWPDRRAGPALDARSDDPVEPRPARRARAGDLRATGGLRRRLHC